MSESKPALDKLSPSFPRKRESISTQVPDVNMDSRFRGNDGADRCGFDSSTQASPVSLHIDRLVIDGMPLAANQVAQLRTAIQHELARLLQQGGSRAWSEGAVPALQAPAIQVSSPFRAADLGRQIALSVHQSLTGSQ